MIYTVTFNPSLDYMVSLEDFKLGKINRTKAECIYPGGKGINVSIVLNNLGMQSTILGFYAGFTGREIVQLLDNKSLCHDMICLSEGLSRINVKVKASEETEINGMGPRINGQDIDRLFEKLDRLNNGDYLVLAGSVPECISKDIYQRILRHLEKRGINIAVDASKDLLSNVLCHRPFVIKPNNHELAEIFGVDIVTRGDAIKYGKILQDKGARNVIVSMAGNGAVLISENGMVYEMDAPKGDVVNSVGAGDSMLAGFIYGYITTGDYEKALKYGISAGSASAFSSELASGGDIEDLYMQL